MTPSADTDFDDWVIETFAAAGPFTMLVVLVRATASVDLLRATHLHVMGDELRWLEMLGLLEKAGVDWSGVVFWRAGREGLVPDAEARRRQDELLRALGGDRSLIRDGDFFNRDGLRLSLEEDAPPLLF